MDDDVDNVDNNKSQYIWVIASFQFVPFFPEFTAKRSQTEKKGMSAKEQKFHSALRQFRAERVTELFPFLFHLFLMTDNGWWCWQWW